jgi:hypothetical protein
MTERGEIGMSPLEWLKGLPTPLAGTAYEPWVQLLQFLLVASVLLSAIIWVLTRRHVIALAHAGLSLLKRASEALVQASRYAPEIERHRQRYARYLMGALGLGFYGWMLVVFGACLVGIPARALVFNLARMTWSNVMVAALFLCAGLCLVRFCLVGATWAWHSITTGEEFTWPQRRASPPNP